jgi:hypothetical protein
VSLPPNATLLWSADDGRLSPSFAVPSMRDTDFPYFQLISMPPQRRLVESLRFKEVLDVFRSGNKTPVLRGF